MAVPVWSARESPLAKRVCSAGAGAGAAIAGVDAGAAIAGVVACADAWVESRSFCAFFSFLR